MQDECQYLVQFNPQSSKQFNISTVSPDTETSQALLSEREINRLTEVILATQSRQDAITDNMIIIQTQ